MSNRGQCTVAFVDITARSQAYDTHLVGALEHAGCSVTTWIGESVPASGTVDGRTDGISRWVKWRPGSRHIRKILKAVGYLLNQISMSWSFWKEWPDIVHYQWLPFAEVAPWVDHMFIWYAKFLGIKVVYTVHNVLPHDTGTRYKQSFSSFYHEVDALICHTVEAKNRLVEEFHVPSNKISVIPHGPLFLPAPKMSKAEAKRAIGYSPNVPLVLFFGRIEPYKGLEFLLRSWNTVSQRVDGAHLLLAGRAYPDEKASLKHQVKHLKVPESVETRFYYLPEEELSLVTKGADVLVYPYRSITQSGAVLTGLAAGKAIVATNVGGIPEVVKDGQTGMLVDYGDHVALARTLVQLLEDAEIRKNLEAGAREMIEEEYSWDTIARKTMVCYQSIINES